MKYPGCPRDKDKRIKLTLEQINSIKKLYKEGGWTHRSLGKEFKVSKTIIRYYLISNLDRKAINSKRQEIHKNRLVVDKEYADKVKKQKVIHNNNLMNRTSELRKWKNEYNRKQKLNLKTNN